MGNDKKEKEEDRKKEKASEVPQSPGEKRSALAESSGEKAIEVPQSPGEKDSAVPQFPSPSSSQLSSIVFEELLDSVIMDLASECYRLAWLDLDCHLDDAKEEIRSSEEARAWVADPGNAEEANRRKVVDVFRNTAPPVASELVECRRCGRFFLAAVLPRHLDRCRKKRTHPRNRDSREITKSKLSNTSHAESGTASTSKEAKTRCVCPVFRCKSRHCKCMKSGNPCTSDCGCKNCENGKDDQPPSSGIAGTSDAATASGLDAVMYSECECEGCEYALQTGNANETKRINLTLTGSSNS